MILIFGGVYQGKLSYALARFGLSMDEVYSCAGAGPAMPEGKMIIYGIDAWIYELVKAGADIETEVQVFISRNTGAVVISSDPSCGVVPADETLRLWREATGRAMAELAGASEEVVRLFCGIPTRLK